MSGDPSMTREQLREAVIEETRRIAELEVEVDFLKAQEAMWKAENDRLTAENDVRLRIIERLREALAFYAASTNYQRTVRRQPNPHIDPAYLSDVSEDHGKRARCALHHDTGDAG